MGHLLLDVSEIKPRKTQCIKDIKFGANRKDEDQQEGKDAVKKGRDTMDGNK